VTANLDDGGLVVQRLQDELLVYDTSSNEAHVLAGALAAEFDAATDEVSRRDVIRRVAFAGATAAGGSALVKTIVAPAPALAQSCIPNDSPCTLSTQCCSLGVCAQTATVGATCCAALNASCTTTADCGCPSNTAYVCCAGHCTTSQICSSDRNLKHHLAPVARLDVLTAFGL
jgi:hypothetical protein